jgi:hypothetical protein
MTRRELFAAGIGATMATVALVSLYVLIADGGIGARGAAGVPKQGATDARASAATTLDTASGDDQAWRTANANLAGTVRLYQRRLEENETERAKIERELKEAKAKLAAVEGDSAPPRNPYDLTQDDWKELAKTGSVRARYPCQLGPDWHIGPQMASTLGLSPEDATAVEAAYKREQDRIWKAIEPACAKVLGNTDLARRLGNAVCTTIINTATRDNHADLQLVADAWAGNKPMPSPDTLSPFATMVLAQTAASRELQTDLAQALGPDEAHRLAFADELGSCSSSWGAPPPKH